MSFFLGPIHYQLFERIKFQDAFCNLLIEAVKERDSELYKKLMNDFIDMSKMDLGDLIDETNIHRSLQGMIDGVERKFAIIISELERKSLIEFDDILSLARVYGKSVEGKSYSAPESGYRLIFEKFLNGMPCDRIQEIISSDENSISWKDRYDIHEKYWKDLGLKSDKYYLIKEEIINGIFENTNLEFESLGGLNYILRRR